MDRAARGLGEARVEATEPRYYPDYYATFFENPDGVRLKVMNFREIRRRITGQEIQLAALYGQHLLSCSKSM